MSRRIDKLAHYCTMVEDIDPRARRCLIALRRSRRDVQFAGHIAQRRLGLEAERVVNPVIQWIAQALAALEVWKFRG